MSGGLSQIISFGYLEWAGGINANNYSRLCLLERRVSVIAHRSVDECQELPEKHHQFAQVQAGVCLRFSAVTLIPGHCFVQPKVHFLHCQRRR